jgi:hypothetical protein
MYFGSYMSIVGRSSKPGIGGSLVVKHLPPAVLAEQAVKVELVVKHPPVE